MPDSQWRQRLLATTRGRVLSLLRWSPRTVNELAAAIGLTDNAVRIHLASLERDGLVEQEGVRRAVGKPAYVYKLTAEADSLFPKAYTAVLSEVLSYVREDRGTEGLDILMRSVGRRAGERVRAEGGDLSKRAEVAAEVLGELGGLVEVEENADSIVMRGYSCPLSSIVGAHPEACALAAELVAGVVGAHVVECCDRSGAPRCSFRIQRSA
jgi:predicted ArsR family transcriptional regulator